MTNPVKPEFEPITPTGDPFPKPPIIPCDEPVDPKPVDEPQPDDL